MSPFENGMDCPRSRPNRSESARGLFREKEHRHASHVYCSRS